MAGILTVATNVAMISGLVVSALLLAWDKTANLPRRSVIILSLLLFVTFGIFTWRPAIELDGVHYYAQARSLAIDGDLDYTNEMRLMRQLTVVRTSSDRLGITFSVGPALFWIPWFPGCALLARVTGVPADGMSWPYVWMVSLMSIAVTAIGIAITWRASVVESASRQDANARLCAVVLFVFATAVPIYAWFQPSFSHAYQFFSSALACWWCMRLWDVVREEPSRESVTAWMYSPLGAFVTGAILGLCFSVRWQSLFMGLVFLGPIWELVRRRAVSWWGWGKILIAVAAGFLIVASVQLAVLRTTWGSQWTTLMFRPTLNVPPGTPTSGPSFLNPAQPEILKVLFSTWNGLFPYHPILIFGVVVLGALAWRREYRWLVAGIVLWMSTELYVCASVWDWWGGGGFGQRRLVSYVPWLASASTIYLFAQDRRAFRLFELRRLVMLIFATLVLWNWLFAGAWANQLIENNAPFDHRAPYDFPSFVQTAANGVYNFLYNVLKAPLVEGA